MSISISKNELFRSDVVDLFNLWEDIPPFVEVRFSQSNGSIHPVVIVDSPGSPILTIKIPEIVTGNA